jgi:hypothetical protein
MPSPHAVIVDGIISRAETACERYRHYAEAKDLGRAVALSRRRTLHQMEITLARLRAQQLEGAEVGGPDHMRPGEAGTYSI